MKGDRCGMGWTPKRGSHRGGPAHGPLQRFLRWLVLLRGSPEALGRGMAIGIVVAFTPTLGVQIPLALFLTTILNANRPISIVPLWITNPATAVPIYAFTYWVGSWFWPGPPMARVRQLLRELLVALGTSDAWQLTEPLRAFAAIGGDAFVALWIGGVIVGSVAALPVYIATVSFVHGTRRRLRARRRRERRSRQRV